MESAEVLALVGGHVEQEILLRNEYLAAENEILKSVVFVTTIRTKRDELPAQWRDTLVRIPREAPLRRRSSQQLPGKPLRGYSLSACAVTSIFSYLATRWLSGIPGSSVSHTRQERDRLAFSRAWRASFLEFSSSFGT